MSTARDRAVEALKDALVDLWAAREILNEDFSTPDEDYAEVKRIIRTPVSLAALNEASVVSMGWFRMRRPAILMTEQKLQRKGQPRAG